jgi:hypothetical protein
MRFQRTLIEGRELPASLGRFAHFLASIYLVLCGGLQPAWASTATTTTTLAVASGGNIVTTVASGTVVTLTATVIAGNTAVVPGQVNFCDAASKYCTDIHLLGTAQLTGNGTAALKFIPGVGSRSYKAVFVGTANNATSASTALTLVVTPARPGTGPLATTTTIAASGSPNNYSLTATVSGNGSVSPTGTVSFLNTSNANAVLGTAVLTAVAADLSFSNNSIPLNTVAVSNQQAISVVTTDFNGDGIPDLALTNGLDSALTILLGNGDGTFTAAASPTASSAASIAVGDFNGDGIPDLAYGTYIDDIPGGVLLGNGDGTFREGQTLATSNSSLSVAVGDFNGDGIADLAFTSICPFGSIPNSVYIFLGKGNGTFTLNSTPVTGANPVSVAVGDFNGDSKPDLAVANNVSNTVTILLGNGDGTFTAAAASPATGSGPTSVAVGDFNGDGKPDLAVTNSGSNTVTVLLGNGDGTFTAAARPATGIAPTSVTVGDFNGDGIADLAVAANAGNIVTILVGHGDGTFTAAASTVSDSGPTSIMAGDFNGDGKTDLAVANETSNTATVLLSVAQSASATVSNIVPMGILLEASYPGDANYSGSVSGIIATPNFTLSGPQFITTTLGASTTSTITIAPSNGFTGSVALTCAVTSSPSVSPPTCSVATPAAVTGTAAGTAVLTVSTQSTTSAGEYTVTVTGISGSITQTLNISAFIPTPTYALAGKAVTIPDGASGTSVITITPSSGFTGSVALVCAVNVDPEVGEAVDLPTCSVTGPVTVSGTAPVTATLNISVPAPSTLETYQVTVTASNGNSIVVPVTVTLSAVSPNFTVTGTAVNIAPGTSGTSTITVTPINGLLGDVTLMCEVAGGPSVVVDAPTCTIPTSVSISGTAAVTTALTVNTQTASSVGAYTVTVTGIFEVKTPEATFVPVNIAGPTPPTPTFTLSNTAVSIPSPGASGTSTITITPSGGFTGSVALACAVSGGPAGAVDMPTCVAATPAAISGTAAVSASVTINTTATSASALQNALQRIFVVGGSAAMAAMLFFGLPLRRRSGKTLLCLLAFAAFTGTAIGCSTAKNNTPTAPANTGTTPGSYIVTVTGTGGTTIATTKIDVVVN